MTGQLGPIDWANLQAEEREQAAREAPPELWDEPPARTVTDVPITIGDLL